MKKVFKKILIPITVLVLWSAGIYRWTGDLTSFTTYSFALYDAGKIPRYLPVIKMKDHNGKNVDFAKWKGKYLLVDFMYLHCSTVCGILRSRLYEFYPELKEQIGNNLMFVSVSFDPERDTTETLRDSWVSVGSHPNWVFASINGNYDEISDSLKNFGVVRYQQENGDFNHTAMYFIIEPGGQLAAIVDPSRGKNKNIEEISRIITEKKI